MITNNLRSKLYQNLGEYFSEDELRTLCFEMEVDYESLPAVGKANKARELIIHLERLKRIPELIEQCRKQRPGIPWEDTPGTSKATSTDASVVAPEQSLAEKPMPDPRALASWESELATGARGDVIIASIGNGNKNLAVGKQISQIVQEGAPGPGDRQVIEQKLAAVTAALGATQGQLDAARAMMADFQLKLLAGELIKTEDAAVPSASTITQVGDWLLDNVPQIAEALASLFVTPAVGKVIGKAGEAAAQWVSRRFGSQRQSMA